MNVFQYMVKQKKKREEGKNVQKKRCPECGGIAYIEKQRLSCTLCGYKEVVDSSFAEKKTEKKYLSCKICKKKNLHF